jgi:hypothetical protein
MGWASGSGLMSQVIVAIKNNVPNANARRAIYTKLIDVFEGEDWDTQQECEGEDPVFDEALKKAHPDWYEP